MKKNLKSWKTTTLGAGGLLYIIIGIIEVLMDDDPTTTPDWGVQVPLMIASIAALFAKDGDKSTEDVK